MKPWTLVLRIAGCGLLLAPAVHLVVETLRHTIGDPRSESGDGGRDVLVFAALLGTIGVIAALVVAAKAYTRSRLLAWLCQVALLCATGLAGLVMLLISNFFGLLFGSIMLPPILVGCLASAELWWWLLAERPRLGAARE